MDYCYVKFKSMSLVDKIKYFKNRFGKFEKTPENYIYYKDLLDEIMLRFYKLALEMRDIGKENVTEVIVKILDYLEDIINKSSFSCDNVLNQYFNKVLFNTYRNITKIRDKSTARENAIITAHIAYEDHLYSIELQEDAFTKSESSGDLESDDIVSLKKMKYIFTKSPKTRYKFFVYFLTQCRNIPLTMIETICSQFNFNYNQTVSIINMANDIAGDGNIQRHKLDDTRRNTGWTRLLVAESSQVSYGFNGDNEKSEQCSQVVSKRKAAHIQRNKQMHHTSLISPAIISDMLNLSRGTVYCHINTSKSLLKWCIGDAPYDEEIFLPKKVIKMIKSGMYVQEYENINLPEFNPFEEFSISLA